MPEYIERGALLAHLEERGSYLFKENGDYDHYTNGFDEAYGRVENFETIDAVPVVRCGECENWRNHISELFGRDCGYCRVCMMDTKTGHFCSYGEKRCDGNG